MSSPGPKWIYQVVISNKDWQDAETWCLENFGEFGVRWYKIGIDPLSWLLEDYQTTWYFKTQADTVAFSLKWS